MQALIRDNFRCVVTGAVDFSSTHHPNTQLKAELSALGQNYDILHTEVAHIFPSSTNKHISSEDNPPEYAANVWAFINRLADHKISEELDGFKIHCLENILTLAVHVHALFDSLALWFEELNMQHTYRVCGSTASVCKFPSTVTFKTNDPLHFPLPRPLYPAFHATCCKVIWDSGAAE
ncbi:hypothetical protein EV424DRAFT_1319276 [Suillus variegatus]|nr:hypothetical protein EV424DRAFT_1319276 [Suillus variegatus]